MLYAFVTRATSLDRVHSCRYRVGETFLHLPHPRAMKRLEHDLEEVNKDVNGLSSDAEECEKGMRELKIVLYAKFGSAINLDE